MNIVEKFSKYLTAIEYPKQETSWNIAGILKGKNAFYRFDVRDMFKLPDGTPAKEGRHDTKAEKVVFEYEKEWLVVDIEELHKYLKKNKLNKVHINELLKKLEWNLIIKK